MLLLLSLPLPTDKNCPCCRLGVWDVTSTLVSVELPEGEAVVPNIAAVRRAQQQDLQQPMQYQVAFMRNPDGRVVYDRRFNTAALLASYYGSNVDFAGRIDWDAKVRGLRFFFFAKYMRRKVCTAHSCCL